jgi:hypothetical protein
MVSVLSFEFGFDEEEVVVVCCVRETGRRGGGGRTHCCARCSVLMVGYYCCWLHIIMLVCTYVPSLPYLMYYFYVFNLL